MPGFDQTGPAGAGSRTGRGMGRCGGGMAYGKRGSGFGYGRFGRWYPAQQKPTKEEETKILNEEAEMLRKDIKEVENRLNELEK